MNEITFGTEYMQELESEANATRKCLERIPEKLFSWKPHPKSMELGYLALLVAEIPRWIAIIVNEGAIDFATFSHFQPKNTAELVAHFEENLESAKSALQKVTNKQLDEDFMLKNNGQLLYKSTKKLNVYQSINHMVHHRGQLTVYMRLNDIAVPSIYGPSADERNF
jgi:uncharacterized damage-inducible protein DinB